MASNSIKDIKEAEKNAIHSIELARKDAEKIVEKARKDAENERQNIIQSAQKKYKELCEKAEAAASADIGRIRDNGKKEISMIQETVDDNISKAVDLIIMEIEKGE